MVLTHSPAEILATWLIEQGVGRLPDDSTGNWFISVDKMPDESREFGTIPYITVYNRRPSPSGTYSMRDGSRQEFFGWQILTRAAKDTPNKSKGKQIADLLDGIYRQLMIVGTTRYTCQRVKRTMPPTFLKQEEKYNQRIWMMEGTMSLYPEGS